MNLPDVIAVRFLGDHRLRLRFDDGVEGDLDLSDRLDFEGVFTPLRDPEYFARVRVDPEAGTICWPNQANIDPLTLHCWVTGELLPDMGSLE